MKKVLYNNPAKRSRLDLAIAVETDPAKIPKVENGKKVSNNSFEQSPDHHFVVLNNLPPVEAAFSIPKIRDQILVYSKTRKDLIKCRHVSRSWCQSATEALLKLWPQNKNKITIAKNSGTNSNRAYSEFCSKSGTLEELMEILVATGLNTFPCNHFEIFCTNLNEDDSLIQAFFNDHGYRVKNLRLYPQYLHSCDRQDHRSLDPCKCGDKWVLKFIKKLLLEQARNAEEIEIGFSSFHQNDRKKINHEMHQSSSVLTETKKIKGVPTTLNSKLKYLEVNTDIPSWMLDSICDLVPGLQKLCVSNFNFYLEPKNRLHLLKEFNYQPYYNRRNSKDEFIQNVANNIDIKKFQLPRLHLFLRCIEMCPEKWNSMAHIINKLFDKICHSLEYFVLSPIGFLPGLGIPQMPKLVELICLDTSEAEVLSQTKFLPPGTRMSEVFPNLRTASLSKNFYTQFRKAAISARNQSSLVEMMPSVRKINIGFAPRRSFNKTLLQQSFPYATIAYEVIQYQLLNY